MLKGHDIIYFGPEKWHGLWRNRQQLMSVFARQNRVLFVEGHIYLRQIIDCFRGRNVEFPQLNDSSFQQVAENLFVFRYPLWAPMSGRFPIKEITRALRRLSIRKVLDKLGMDRPIVWFSRPDMVELIKEIPSPRLMLYHVVDEYTAYGGQTAAIRRAVQEEEKRMMTSVDAVIVVSKKLYESKRCFNSETYLVPNGVNYQAYTSALADPELPNELRAIKAPRLGYSGLIGDKLNFDMLELLAREHPEWSLVFIGEIRVNQQIEIWRRLLAMPNVHYLGLVDISLVPDYLKAFDVGLMPYLQNRKSEHISPLKLYDYLAAGLPVVSIDIPSAREFSAYIHLANSPKEFTGAVRSALSDTAPDRRQIRRDIASQQSWEVRVEQLSKLIKIRLLAKAKKEDKV